MSTLAELIKERMDVRNVSVADLSYDLDVSYPTASKIAKGEVSRKAISAVE